MKLKNIPGEVIDDLFVLAFNMPKNFSWHTFVDSFSMDNLSIDADNFIA